jgi:uncharacterized protein (TIGR03435 family)
VTIAKQKSIARMTAVLLCPIVAALLVPNAFAQRLEFEVASVKPDTVNGPSDLRGPRRSGDSVVMHNTQLYSMIFYAYGLSGTYEMVGFTPLPDGWNWYDVEARAAASATDDQIRLMFQSLLADRFKLKVHREKRDLPQFELKIANGKPKLKPSTDGPMTLTIEGKPLTARPGTCGTSLWQEGSRTICHAADLATIASQFSRLVGAPVADKTGLTGTYDVNYVFIPDDRLLQADAPPGPSLMEAIQQELGLKLEKGKGTVEVLVIDHLEKPSEN